MTDLNTLTNEELKTLFKKNLKKLKRLKKFLMKIN